MVKFRKKFVDNNPDYTQEEIAKHFGVGSSTVSRTLKKINYSRKKSKNYSERNDDRQAYQEQIKSISPSSII